MLSLEVPATIYIFKDEDEREFLLEPPSHLSRTIKSLQEQISGLPEGNDHKATREALETIIAKKVRQKEVFHQKAKKHLYRLKVPTEAQLELWEDEAKHTDENGVSTFDDTALVRQRLPESVKFDGKDMEPDAVRGLHPAVFGELGRQWLEAIRANPDEIPLG